MAQAVLLTLRDRLAERANPQQYLLLRRRLCNCSSAADARQALAELFVRITDEQFDQLNAAFDPFDGNAFFSAISEPYSRRRAVVVGAAFERLVSILNSKTVTATEAASAVIPFSTICDYCDFSRNAPKERAEDERQTFLTMLNVGDALSLLDFQAFYRGQSHAIGSDKDDRYFELFVTRTWNLDRAASGNLTAAQSLAASKCSASLSRSVDGASKLGGTGSGGAVRAHPLYSTSNGAFGKNLDQAFAPVTKHNRTGEFTKHEPAPQPSSGLNTAPTRARFM